MPKSKPIAVANSVVLDTNILVSALIGSSYPKQILFDCIFQKKIPICLSEVVLKEYQEVLKRPKFQKHPNFISKAYSLIENIERIAEFYEPKVIIERIFDDADNRFLELAITAQADYIITGNFNDFNFYEYEGVKIVSPKYFFENCCGH